MDLVYILGKGSLWSNNEIRYSLRSIFKNLTHRKVFVIGEKCDWFSKKVIHIPAEDPYTEKLRNALYKLNIACNDERISSNFILMNDDFFIMKKLGKVEPLYKGTLKQSLSSHHVQGGYYFDAIKDTIDFLGNEKALDYSLHYPFVFNKTKLKKVIAKIEQQDNQILLRTVYGNLNNIGGKKKKDGKARSSTQFVQIRNKVDVLSTADSFVRYPRFREWIKRKFPTKSIYEV